jgi:hypothetical protein
MGGGRAGWSLNPEDHPRESHQGRMGMGYSAPPVTVPDAQSLLRIVGTNHQPTPLHTPHLGASLADAHRSWRRGQVSRNSSEVRWGVLIPSRGLPHRVKATWPAWSNRKAGQGGRRDGENHGMHAIIVSLAWPGFGLLSLSRDILNCACAFITDDHALVLDSTVAIAHSYTSTESTSRFQLIEGPQCQDADAKVSVSRRC